MDTNTLIILKSDLNAQMDLINNITNKLKERSQNLRSDDLIRLESIAYQIHNLYNAMEDLLKIVATYFENNISDTSKWPSLLLQRMTQEIPEIRPAFLSAETYSILNSLRGFRHFFRHAYNTNIEYEQLEPNLTKSLKILPSLQSDISIFVAKLADF